MDASKILPNELWLQAFGYLSKPDLKALRLSADPLFASLASSLLFTTAYIAARRGVLDTFKNLTTHPVFCKYVKEIVFDSSWIDPATVSRRANGKNGPALTRLFEEQEVIQANELQTALENAFKCLSNVRKVSYADLSRISWLPGDNHDSAWDGDYSDGPLLRRLESNLESGEMSLCCFTAEKHSECPRHNDKFRYRRILGGLVLLLEVLPKYASKTLLQLSLGDRAHSRRDGGIPHWFLWPRTDTITLHSSSTIFHNLQKLELTVSDVHHAGGHPENPEARHLVQLLSLAENLEELKLTSDGKAAECCLIDTVTWARLRVLYLKGFEASAEELKDFLQRHTRSLESMTLDCFNLTTGSWRDSGTLIPATNPRLNFILGLLAVRNREVRIDAVLPLSYKDLDLSGPKPGRSTKADSHDEEEDQDEEEEDGSSSEELDYSSDDSSSETDEPRRKPDLDLLNTMDPELRSLVERLRSKLSGCPVQECLKALDAVKARNTTQELSQTEQYKLTRKTLMRKFGYTELEAMDPETRACVERLMDEVPFDCDVLECKEAVRSSKGNYDGARQELQWRYGYRQKIFMGGRR